MVPALGLDPVAQWQLTELPSHFQTLLGTKDTAAPSGLSRELVLQGPESGSRLRPLLGSAWSPQVCAGGDGGEAWTLHTHKVHTRALAKAPANLFLGRPL